MSGIDDRLRRGLGLLALPADPEGAFEDVQRRMRRIRRNRRLVVAGAAAALVGIAALGSWSLLGNQRVEEIPLIGPSPGMQTEAPEPYCSAAGLAVHPEPQADLADAVAETRREIVRLALACDYETLEALATRDGEFTFSFGDGAGAGAADFWRRSEQAGEEPLRFLVELLDRPYRHAVSAGAYVWPSAAMYDDWDDVPLADRDALQPLYDEDDFREFGAFGSYIGYRIAITSDGQWLYFVAGD